MDTDSELRPAVYVATAMSPDYLRLLHDDLGIRMAVEFTSKGRDVTDYAVVLIRGSDETAETIRVYEGAHGRNEIESGYRQMIEGWERQ